LKKLPITNFLCELFVFAIDLSDMLKRPSSEGREVPGSWYLSQWRQASILVSLFDHFAESMDDLFID
jgi:hypothetical protein